MANLRTLFLYSISIFWILAMLALSATAFWRFRRTPAGWLMGTGFALLGLKAVVMNILNRWVLKGIPYDDPGRIVSQIVSMGLEFILLALVAAGILLIPAAMRRLSSRSPNLP